MGDSLSLIYRIVFIMIMSIGVSAFVYPLLHESGHLIAGLLVGYDIVDYSIFPSPYITFLTDGDYEKIYFISVFSVVLPILVSVLIPKKIIAVHLCACAVVFLDISYTIIMAVYSVLYMCGFSVTDNDATAVLSLCKDNGYIYFLSLALVSIIGLCVLVYKKPYNSMEQFLTKRKAQDFSYAENTTLCRTYGSN